jgi:D-3-phosphoglycerate dehydrogenase / 2-oxoglutarate reductase
MRILVVGDPYMPVSVYSEPLAALGERVTVTAMQIDGTATARPRTESEHRLREYVGDPAEIARAVVGNDVLIVHGAPVSAEVLDAASLRLVCCARGGPVNVDIAAASDRGIPVASTPGKNAEAVAELTLGFALLLIRAMPQASRYLLDGGGGFAESVFEGREFFGREAPGMTLGLVGLGHVAREVASRAGALGFRLLAYDPQPPREPVPGVDLVPLEILLERSDIVSMHARATADNRHMFSAERFRQMRPGAYFINTARESLVDEPALCEALAQGLVGGAALDVLERTAAGQRNPLLDMPNVFVTPHIGGATAETLTRGAQRAVDAVADLLSGRLPANLVNPQVLRAAEGAT